MAGAFDPFDEREAQRVQADGVLKKPFVPPDPLINAVKTLLEKSAAERLMAATVPTSAIASVEATKPAVAAAEPESASQDAADVEAEAYAQPLTVVELGTKDKKDKTPSSFASSVEFPVLAADEAEPVVTASRDPVLGEPAFWVPEEEEQEETEPEPPQDLTEHTWKSSARPASMREDPPLMLELELPGPAVHDIDLLGAVMSGEEAVEEAQQPEVKPSVPAFDLAAASESPCAAAPLTQTSAEDTASLPDNRVETTPPELSPVESSIGPSQSATAPAAEPAEEGAAEDLESELAKMPEISVFDLTAEPEPAVRETEEPTLLELSDGLPAFADYSEAVHSSLGAALEAAVEEEAAEPEQAPEFAISWPPAFVPVTAGSPDVSAAAESAPAPATIVRPEAKPEPLSSSAATLSPEDREAVIQRVIERMQPQIVEMVTQQILRPLVESLVREEFGK